MAFCEAAAVVAIARLTPSFVRVRFRTLGGWTWFSRGTGDERIDILFPFPGEAHADISHPNDERRGVVRIDPPPPWRHYTVRDVHAGGREFDVDFVLHDSGIASDWARSASPGCRVGVFRGSPVSRSYHDAPTDAAWQLLVADATGLPGLARILEEIPQGTSVRAVVEVPTPSDRAYSRHLRTVDNTVDWMWVGGRDDRHASLVAAVADLSRPDGPGYAWAACEASTARRIREVMRTRLHIPRSRHRAIGYWTAGAQGHTDA